MPEIDSYTVVPKQQIDRLEDLVDSFRDAVEDPVYADEPWGLNDSFAEGMYLLGEMKTTIRNVEKQLLATYKTRTNR